MSPDRVVPAVARIKWVGIVLLALAVLSPVTGAVAFKALTTANSASTVASTAACKGANEAKTAVSRFLNTVIERAQAPIQNATPDQIQRQQASVAAYEAVKAEAAKDLRLHDCTVGTSP